MPFSVSRRVDALQVWTDLTNSEVKVQRHRERGMGDNTSSSHSRKSKHVEELVETADIEGLALSAYV